VFDEVMAKLPLTLELIVLALFFELLIAVPAGVISAVKPYTWWDYGASTFALVGVSVPSFFLGILLFLTFGLWLGWLPVQGYVPHSESVSDNLRRLLLPTVALGLARTAMLTRLIRASMLEVIRQEYVTTARSKGLAERIVISKHALKNALIPAVTVLGLQVGFLVGGAIIIEKLFALPGIGSYGIDAISNRDYPQVLGFILVSAEMHPEDMLRAPSPKYLLGTDQMGRDVLSRVIYGSRISVYVGVVSTLFGAALGVLLGVVAAYYGGVIDNAIMRLIDIWVAFPNFLLALVISAILGPSVTNVVIALAIFITVLGFNLFGDGLRDALDLRLKQ
jgi:ABC-type dipeptide/oligopeptide/nickel transport system permease component